MEVVHIKKYGNRRFYSSLEKNYITLVEIKNLVQRGHRIQVVDAETENDITSEILTQILLEQGRASHFPVELLEQMIRVNEKTLKTLWAPVVEQNLKLMMQMGDVAFSSLKLLTNSLPGSLKKKSKGKKVRSLD